MYWLVGLCKKAELKPVGRRVGRRTVGAKKLCVSRPPNSLIIPGVGAVGSAADVPSFVLVEVLLSQTKRTDEKKAFRTEFHTAVEARHCCRAANVLLRFIEMPGENLDLGRESRML